jgi:O-antigen ligase
MGSSTTIPEPGLLEPGETLTEDLRREDGRSANQPQSASAYFCVLLFFVVYCARPEDWIPGLAVVPLAKIAGVLCALSFVVSIPRLRQRLPREAIYLALLVFQLWLTVPLSPVWRGGAFDAMLDFSKVLLIVLVMGVAVTTMKRLRQLIFVQTASVVAIAAVSLAKGSFLEGRIQGAVHGIYENSNELALISMLSLPFCVAFLLRTRSWFLKGFWAAAAALMVYGTMLTGSRGGLLALVVSGSVCLWEFGVRGKRTALFVAGGLLGVTLILFAGNTVKDRFEATFGDPSTGENGGAYGSAMQRQELFWKALAVTADHPLFGVGPGNFNSISGMWHDQHNTYTQMSSDGGVPAFILYLLLMWCALRNLKNTNKLAPLDSDERLFAMALRASLCGFLVGSFFTASAYHFFPYFLVAYSTGLMAIAQTKYGNADAAETSTDISPDYDVTAAAFPAR